MKFEEISCKTFHGSLTDFKYVPKVNMFVIMRNRRMDHALWKCTDYIHSFFSLRIYVIRISRLKFAKFEKHFNIPEAEIVKKKYYLVR